MPAVATPPTPHWAKHRALPSTGGHGSFTPCSRSGIPVLHLAIVQAGAEGLAHALRVVLAIFHCKRGFVPLHPPATDLLQGQGVLGVERVVLMGV